MKQVKTLLEAWSNWSGSRIGTEYRRMWPLVQQESDLRLTLSDEEGMRVDRAVGRLKKIDVLAYRIVLAYYRGKLSCRAIAREIRRDHEYISAYLSRSEAYIAGLLEGVLEEV